MFFNSIEYAFFLPIVFILYWFVFKKSYKIQNLLLVASSYFFYACWDWRFLFLLAFSTILDFVSGLKIEKTHSRINKKIWLILSVGINLGFLGIFKYYNFFVESFAELLATIGITAHTSTLNIILPVGISFYTFHGLSYVFDIYNNKIKPCHSWINYSLFVSFFPLLVAGPIERATHLLPQVEKPRTFNYSKSIDGLRQILWGLFKKVVIADNCAALADNVFNNPDQYHGSSLILGAIFFSIQIYGDFSGYSDIALGSARLLGFELLKNFSFPYFSRDIAEFWRRWHISLSSWFKDYVYIPLGGSRGSMIKTIQNTFIIFLVSGFWHGANWTFLAWGGLNALFILPSIIFKSNRRNLDVVAQGRILPSFNELFQVTSTFLLSTFAWIFFRAESIQHALEFIQNIFTPELFSFPKMYSIQVLLLIPLFFSIEWVGRESNYAIEELEIKVKSRLLRWCFYYFIGILIFLYSGHHQAFIYFQF